MGAISEQVGGPRIPQRNRGRYPPASPSVQGRWFWPLVSVAGSGRRKDLCSRSILSRLDSGNPGSKPAVSTRQLVIRSRVARDGLVLDPVLWSRQFSHSAAALRTRRFLRQGRSSEAYGGGRFWRNASAVDSVNKFCRTRTVLTLARLMGGCFIIRGRRRARLDHPLFLRSFTILFYQADSSHDGK